MSNLLTLDQAASYLQVSPRMLREHRHRWGLRATKVGRHLRFRMADIEKYLLSQREAA